VGERERACTRVHMPPCHHHRDELDPTRQPTRIVTRGASTSPPWQLGTLQDVTCGGSDFVPLSALHGDMASCDMTLSWEIDGRCEMGESYLVRESEDSSVSQTEALRLCETLRMTFMHM